MPVTGELAGLLMIRLFLLCFRPVSSSTRIQMSCSHFNYSGASLGLPTDILCRRHLATLSWAVEPSGSLAGRLLTEPTRDSR